MMSEKRTPSFPENLSKICVEGFSDGLLELQDFQHKKFINGEKTYN